MKEEVPTVVFKLWRDCAVPLIKACVILSGLMFVFLQFAALVMMV